MPVLDLPLDQSVAVARGPEAALAGQLTADALDVAFLAGLAPDQLIV